VDLVKTLSFVSSLVQTFYFCFCIFSTLVDDRNQRALWAVSEYISYIYRLGQKVTHFYPYLRRILTDCQIVSPVHSVENLQQSKLNIPPHLNRIATRKSFQKISFFAYVFIAIIVIFENLYFTR